MWRLRLFYERVGWKPFAIGAGIVVLVAVAAGAAIALLGGGDTSSSAPTTTAVQERTNVYYLRAVAPETHVQGCSMRIRFLLKPDYHAIQYLGERDHHRDRNGHRRFVQKEVHAQGARTRSRPCRPERRVQGLVGESDRHGRRSAR